MNTDLLFDMRCAKCFGPLVIGAGGESVQCSKYGDEHTGCVSARHVQYARDRAERDLLRVRSTYSYTQWAEGMCLPHNKTRQELLDDLARNKNVLRGNDEGL